MRIYRVKMNCVISIKMDDSVEPCDFEEMMFDIIENDFEEQGWKVEELDIKKWEEVE